MAVPKATETRYRDGSVEARQVIKDHTGNPICMLMFPVISQLNSQNNFKY